MTETRSLRNISIVSLTWFEHRYFHFDSSPARFRAVIFHALILRSVSWRHLNRYSWWFRWQRGWWNPPSSFSYRVLTLHVSISNDWALLFTIVYKGKMNVVHRWIERTRSFSLSCSNRRTVSIMTARRSFKVCSSCFSCWRVMFNVGDVLNVEVEELIERPERVRCFIPLPLALTPNVLVPLLVTVGVMKQDEGLFSAFALRWFTSVGGASFIFSSERVADAARRRNAANITVCL